MQFNPAQRDKAVALVEGIAWGEMDTYISILELGFRIALKVTVPERTQS
jgi:hypothetical protein